MLTRSSYYYRKTMNQYDALRQRMMEIAKARPRYGYRRVHVLLLREGWRVNHKQLYRIYKEEGLSLRYKRPKRRISAAHRLARPNLTGINQCWSMDFVADH
jgi:putative transposase